MIFYKRKSKIKKLVKHIFKRREIKSFSSFKLLKNFSVLLSFFILFLYIVYLLFLPKFVNEKNVELILNSYLSKKTKFILDLDNLKISPNYKFDIVISADKAKLKYSKNK